MGACGRAGGFTQCAVVVGCDTYSRYKRAAPNLQARLSCCAYGCGWQFCNTLGSWLSSQMLATLGLRLHSKSCCSRSVL